MLQAQTKRGWWVFLMGLFGGRAKYATCPYCGSHVRVEDDD